MIEQRLKNARLSAGLTLAELGERVGVSHTAIQKYEKGQTAPSSSALLKIAQACGVRTEYFFRDLNTRIEGPDFRKHSAFGKKAQQALLLKVAVLAEKRMELLQLFPHVPLPKFEVPPELAGQISDYEQIEAVAESLRHAWNLGLNPIADLTDTLEKLGVLVIAVDEQNPKFSGLTGIAVSNDGQKYPVIAVSNLWPGDRQRFTLAHELGHLVLGQYLSDALDEEKACDRFAGAFLVPAEAVTQYLGSTRTSLEWRELYTLKHEFGLSMQAWLYRAKQCKVLTEAKYLRLVKMFSRRGWRKSEPGNPLPAETPQLFEQLIYRALAEQFISESKAAEFLGVPLMQFHKDRNMEGRYAAAD